MPPVQLLRYLYQYSLGEIERLVIRFRSFDRHPPIFVYQMGKVGSSSVERSLKVRGIRNPVYHVHFFSDARIASAERYYRSINARLPRHLKRSKALREKADRNEIGSWKIITLVRDPVAREISNVFQNMRDFNPDLIDANGNIKTKLVADFLTHRFSTFDEETDFACTWFDKEIRIAFDVDVFSYDFDLAQGYQLIRKGNVEVLVLRMEDLNKRFEEAMAEFLGCEKRIELRKRNLAKNKPYHDVYKSVIGDIRLSRPVCEKIYASNYVRHFYSKEMIEELVTKWTS